MTELDSLLTNWNLATSKLPYGVQRAFHDVLTLVKEEKKSNLVWGMDYGDKSDCLVNASAPMLTTGGGKGVPSRSFGEIVGLYDRINRELRARDVNTSNLVSPMAAEILLHHYAPFKDAPTQPVGNPTEAFAEGVPYVEPTDEELSCALLSMLEGEAPAVEVDVPFDQPVSETSDVQSQ